MGRYLGAGECKKCGKAAWRCRCIKDPRIPRKKKDDAELPSEEVPKKCPCGEMTKPHNRTFFNGRWYHPGCDVAFNPMPEAPWDGSPRPI